MPPGRDLHRRSYDVPVAALAYVLLPLSGLIAFLTAGSARVRFHGLQAIAVGLVWPLLLYAGSLFSPVAARIAFAVGAVVWVVLLGGTLMGKDPKLPGVSAAFAATASFDSEEGD